MKTIYKALLDSVKTNQEIELPNGSRILSCANQNGQLYVWFICEDDQPTSEKRYFYVLDSGQKAPDKIHMINFIGTVLFHDGKNVVHVFEGKILP